VALPVPAAPVVPAVPVVEPVPAAPVELLPVPAVPVVPLPVPAVPVEGSFFSGVLSHAASTQKDTTQANALRFIPKLLS
jgi:hypothetical protein